MSKLSFDVTGMHCASCAAAVERAVKKLPGALGVSLLSYLTCAWVCGLIC